MEDTDHSSIIKGGIKIPVDVPPDAWEALKPSPKVLPKPREHARSVAAGSALANLINFPVDVPPHSCEPPPEVSQKRYFLRERVHTTSSIASVAASANHAQGEQNYMEL